VAPAGKQVLAGLQIWRDDVNAKGGLLGRPIELVFYDDQTIRRMFRRSIPS
jgi:branched-chain amino acid transport system substrate-binding protein